MSNPAEVRNCRTVDALIPTFLTDMSEYGDFKLARNEIFGTTPPASTAVVSPALAVPGAVVEIEAVAQLS